MLRRLGYLLAVTALAAAAPAQAELRILEVWGSEGTGEGQFRLPDGIGVDNAGHVFVADRDNNRLWKFDHQGELQPFPAFRHQHRDDADGRFNLPYDAAPDALGNIYVADTHNHRIQMFSPKGRFIRKWGSKGVGDGQFDQPRDVAVDVFGFVWVADHDNARVQKFTRDGQFLLKAGANGADGSFGSGPGEFNSPRGLSSDAEGNIYVADDANHRIVKLDNQGRYLRHYGVDGFDYFTGSSDPGRFKLPYGTAVDQEGHVWVADTNNSRVVEFDPADGRTLSLWGRNGGDGTSGPEIGEFEHAYNVATDCVGNVYATDEGNHRVVKIGDPSLPPPVCPPRLSGVEVDGADVSASCDRPCRLRAVARVRGVRKPLRSRMVTMWSAGEATLELRVPAAARGKSARVVVTAQGAPGAQTRATRNTRLP